MKGLLVLVWVAPAVLLAGCSSAAEPAGRRVAASGSTSVVSSAPTSSSETVEPGRVAATSAGHAAAVGVGEVRTCAVEDLEVHLRPEREGAGGHLLSFLDFRNASHSTCLLQGYPDDVSLVEPGHPAVVATRGTFFPVPDSRAMRPGESTALGIETDSTCAGRPDGGPPGPIYHRVRLRLPGGLVDVPVADGLDVGCGAAVTRFTSGG